MPFSPSAPVFRLASLTKLGEKSHPLLNIIVKAKKSYVAYEKALPKEESGPGRPPKYGKKIHLIDLFDDPSLFSKAQCKIYGRVEEVLITYRDLLWKPTGTLIRFVFATTSRGSIVLMCSNLTQDPLKALILYCLRVRIETTFDMMKNLIGAFNYRFWSKYLPYHSRRPKKNSNLKAPSSKNIKSVKSVWEAYECFVLLGGVALGILQLISLKYKNLIWSLFDDYLRTYSREYPSERAVKWVVKRAIVKNFHDIKPDGIIQKIIKRLKKKKLPVQYFQS